MASWTGWTSCPQVASTSSFLVGTCRYRVALATLARSAITFNEAPGDSASAPGAAARTAVSRLLVTT